MTPRDMTPARAKALLRENGQAMPPFELCFFVTNSDALVRWRLDENGMVARLPQVSYRCGSCATVVGSTEEQRKHFDEHRATWARSA